MMEATQTTIGNKDLIRLVLWFCGEDSSEGGRIFKSNIRLQKIVFLAQKEFPEFKVLKNDGIFIDDEFEFEANNFGPFSQDLVKMVRGRFRTEDKEVSIEKVGYTNIYKIQQNLITNLREKFEVLIINETFTNWVKKINLLGNLPPEDLLRKVYENKKYQEYLTKSKIANRFKQLD